MYYNSEIHSFLQKTVEFVFGYVLYNVLLFLMLPVIKSIVSIIFKINGIQINGDNPWDVKINDDRFYALLASKGGTGFCEAYYDGYFDCDDLETFMLKLISTTRLILLSERCHPYRLLIYFIHRYFDVMTSDMCPKSVNDHYNTYIDTIRECLDPTAHYSTMLLYDLKEIEEANSEEIDEILNTGVFRARENVAKKLKLEPGMKVLDIGCGFGGLAKHLAERYNVEVTGVTISKHMAAHAKKVCEGLPVNIELRDYRTITGKFDRIASIGMFEHVGETHHREYFEKVHSLLKDDGIFVFESHHFNHDYMFSYSPIFDKSFRMYCYLPRLEETAVNTRGLLIIEDIENIGYCGGLTAKAVLKKGIAKLDVLKKRTTEKELRELYFLACSSVALGLSGIDRIFQIVFSKNGLRYAYQY